MNAQLPQLTMDSTAQLWMSVDELKSMALSAGCAPEEFARAAEIMGNHPLRVARYLKRHSFVPRTFEIPQGGRFPAWQAAIQKIITPET
jgi:hypothetical protein